MSRYCQKDLNLINLRFIYVNIWRCLLSEVNNRDRIKNKVCYVVTLLSVGRLKLIPDEKNDSRET